MRRPNYSADEVRALVEGYAAVLEKRDTTSRGLRAVVRVADLHQAWRRLSLVEREVLLRVGVVGQSTRDAAEEMQKAQKWVDRMYRRTLEDLTWLMNGGI